MTTAVFTLRSLREFLDNGMELEQLPALAADADSCPTADIAVVQEDGHLFCIHRKDEGSVRRLLLRLSDDDAGLRLPSPAAQAESAILDRCHALGLLASASPVRLPVYWGQYKFGGLISYFACTREKLPAAVRCIAEVRHVVTRDVCFWRLTDSRSKVRLEAFTPPSEVYESVINAWASAREHAKDVLAARVAAEPTDISDVELASTLFNATTQNNRFSEWIERLTVDQKTFVMGGNDHSVKLRGPAGSGKTLALELKALRAAKAARDDGAPIRILFVTHSWMLASEVDADIDRLSEWGRFDDITVLPLLAVAQDTLPPERWNAGLRLVGEDSLSGNRAQLERIERIMQEFVAGDWVTFREDASPSLRARIDSPDSVDRHALTWDLLIEFGCVLGADGIFPGVNAEPRYLRLPRAAWMMPLVGEGDRRVVLYIYERYMASLLESGELTSDQLINDFLNYLETYIWDVRRRAEGYDLIFVDEFHLFNVQERQILRYLARSPSEYPRIFMAVDPRQSPWEVYRELGPTRGSDPSVVDDVGLGEVASVELSTVYRFSPEILNLVRHLNMEFPNLDLGSDWDLDFSAVTSVADHGPKPSVISCGSRSAEVVSVFEAGRGARAVRVGRRAAIAVVDNDRFGEYESVARGLQGGGGVSVVASRDDVDSLQYRRRSLVIGPAEYLAGLQFDVVYIAGLPDLTRGLANQAYRRRRFLSLMYLAITRASVDVRLFVNDECGGVPSVLESAVKRGIAHLERGRTV